MNETDDVEVINSLVTNMISWIRSKDSNVAELLVKAYNEDDVDSASLEEIVSFFLANSVVFSAVMASPGSSVISELFYDQPYSDSAIDQYFYNSKGGSAVKGRLEAMQQYIPLITQRYLNRQKEVSICSLGSGPGRYIINIFLELRKKGHQNSVKAYCFDIDENALIRGKRLAALHHLNNCIRFKRADFNRNLPEYYSSKFDILILKGILCPYDSKGCRTILEHVKPMLKPEGLLIASNVSKKMSDEDPFTCFLMNKIANWVMVYKDKNELRSIFMEAGYKWQGSFTDELGFHIMGIGSPNSDL